MFIKVYKPACIPIILFQVSFHTSNLLHQAIKPIKVGFLKKSYCLFLSSQHLDKYLACRSHQKKKKKRKRKNETGLAHDPIAN